ALGICRDPRSSAAGERGKYRLVAPRRVTELERHRHLLRNEFQEGLELVDVDPRVRRQLEQHDPKARPKRLQCLEEPASLLATIGKLLEMRDAAWRLDGEAKAFRHLRGPAREHVRLRHAVERVVDLDRWQAAGIEGKHFVRGQLLGIEGALPLLERKSAGPAVELHRSVRSKPRRWWPFPGNGRTRWRASSARASCNPVRRVSDCRPRYTSPWRVRWRR